MCILVYTFKVYFCMIMLCCFVLFRALYYSDKTKSIFWLFLTRTYNIAALKIKNCWIKKKGRKRQLNSKNNQKSREWHDITIVPKGPTCAYHNEAWTLIIWCFDATTIINTYTNFGDLFFCCHFWLRKYLHNFVYSSHTNMVDFVAFI